MCYFSGDIEQLLLEKTDAAALDDWGHRACKLSRQIHIFVWRKREAAETVAKLVDLLTLVRDRLDASSDCKFYHRNIGIRIGSLRSYLKGEGPVVPPGAEDEERALVDLVEEWYAENPCACSGLTGVS